MTPGRLKKLLTGSLAEGAAERNSRLINTLVNVVESGRFQSGWVIEGNFVDASGKKQPDVFVVKNPVTGKTIIRTLEQIESAQTPDIGSAHDLPRDKKLVHEHIGVGSTVRFYEGDKINDDWIIDGLDELDHPLIVHKDSKSPVKDRWATTWEAILMYNEIRKRSLMTGAKIRVMRTGTDKLEDGWRIEEFIPGGTGVVVVKDNQRKNQSWDQIRRYNPEYEVND